ncbi:MAG: ribosome-binding factor A [Bdellovibrionota bacterium]
MGRNENRGGSGSGGNASNSHRVHRVEREVRDVVGTLLLAGLSADVPSFVSVSRVQMTSDLRTAKVYVVTMSEIPVPVATLDEEKNVKDDKEYRKKLAVERKTIVKALNESAYEVQNAIARKLQMRFTPTVTFLYDEGFDNAMRVDSILRGLGASNKSVKPEATGEDDE